MTATKYDHNKWHELYAAGLDDSAIARESGASRCTVLCWRRKHGLPANCKRPAVDDADEAMRRRMYERGATDQAIADVAGCTKHNIAMWRKSRGLPAHQRQRAGVRYAGAISASAGLRDA